MNKIQQIAARPVNFVRRNQTKILITTTVVSTTAAVVMRSSVAQHNEFLRQHNLFDEFYAITSETA